MDEKENLGPLLDTHRRLSREATKRRRSYEEKSISKKEVDDYLKKGWKIQKELKIKVKMRRQREISEKLENKTWLLMYLLGYDEINSGRNFKIKIKRKGAGPVEKQIDVFAKDSETVIVTECKASKRIRKRSLQKDIEEFANLKGPIANAIKRHYGQNFRPKILWLFITENIVWSEPDKQRAKGQNIRIITERELRYYLQIADHLRRAARYQFLAEFLKNQKIPGLQGIKVPAIRGKLGGKKFYSFISTPEQILKVAFINHRSLNDPDGAPSYQRLVTRTRLRQISNFIKNGGFFPNNILINFKEKQRFDVISKDEDTNVTFGNLYLPSKYRTAWVIDGQHRLYGFAPLEQKQLKENIMLVAFEQLNETEEANLFVTINHEQKTVPKTLLDDLEGELKWGSEIPSERIGSISARLIGLLNMDIGEPLYGRVTQQGITATEKTCLTVPAIKDGIRKSGLIGRAAFRNREYEPGPLTGLNDSETLDRARSSLNSYFGLIENQNTAQWEKGRKGFLCTNVAIQAYLLLFGSLIQYMEQNKGLNSRQLNPQEIISEIEEYLDPILKWIVNANAIKMEKYFKVQFGSGGPIEYYFRLCKIVKSSFSDFIPEGFSDWEEEQSSERVNEADRKLKELNIQVQKYIFDKFKEIYGIEKDAYWNKGIVDKKIKSRAYEKSLDDDDEDRLPLENYLDFIQYKKIVEHKHHWKLFKPVFDIPKPGEKGYSKNIRWMEKINELRRIPAHATEKRLYKMQDFDYIDFIHEEFMAKIESEKIGVLNA